MNSYQNGATSWIPKELPPNVRIVVAINSGNSASGVGKSGSGADREVQRFVSCIRCGVDGPGDIHGPMARLLNMYRHFLLLFFEI